MKKFRKYYNLILSYGFFMILAVFLLACILIQDKEFSDMENRSLQIFPKLNMNTIASGAFMSEFETYASDQVIGRDFWVKLKNSGDKLIGKKDNGSAYWGREGYLFSMEKIDMEQLAKNTSYLLKFKGNIEKKGLKLSVAAVPTSSEILYDKLIGRPAMADEAVVLKSLNDSMGEASIDLRGVLREHKDEYIYYKTDHHWTTLGAYYGYRKIMSRWGGNAEEPSRYKKEKVSDKFLGTTYSKIAGFNTGSDDIYRYLNYNIENSTLKIQKSGLGRENFDTIESRALFAEEKLATKDKYAYFLGGNDPLVRIDSPKKNGRALLIIKDSYANCLSPFFTDNYEQIYSVDLRYYRGNILELIEEIRKDMDLTDVLVIYNAIQISNDRNLVFLLR